MNSGFYKKLPPLSGLQDFVWNIEIIKSKKDYDAFHAKAANERNSLIRETLLVFDSPPNEPITINGETAILTKQSAVVSKGASLVIAKHNSSVLALDTTEVRAYDSAAIQAAGYSFVRLHDRAKADLRGSSKCLSQSQSAVSARESSQVKAAAYSTVIAAGSTQITALHSSSVRAEQNSKVNAKDHSIITASHNAQVLAQDNSTVFTKGNNVKLVLKDNSVSIPVEKSSPKIINTNKNTIIKENTFENFTSNVESLARHYNWGQAGNFPKTICEKLLLPYMAQSEKEKFLRLPEVSNLKVPNPLQTYCETIADSIHKKITLEKTQTGNLKQKERASALER
jgi:hypothetical protein